MSTAALTSNILAYQRPSRASALASTGKSGQSPHHGIDYHELLESVWLNSSDAMRITDSRGMVAAANETYCRLVGLQVQELIGKPFTLVYDESVEPSVLLGEYCARFRERNAEPLMSRRMRLRNGKEIYVETSNSFVKGGDDAIFLLSIIRDITDRQAAEEALRHEKALLDALMDNIPDSIYFKDRECRLVRINRKMMQDLKMDEMSQAVGKTDVELFGEEFGRQTLANDQRLMTTGEPIVGLVESRQLQDGQTNLTLTTKVPMCDDSGQIVGLVGITREINELMKAQEDRDRDRNLLHILIDNLPDLIYFKDAGGRYVLNNRAHLRSIGAEHQEDALGKTTFDFNPPELAKQYHEDEVRIAQTGKPLLEKEELALHKDTGERRWHLTSKIPTVDAQGTVTGIVGMSRDITERKELEARAQDTLSALQASRESLAQLNAQKDRLLSVLSHDLRSPFTSILGFCEILLTDGETVTDAERTEFLSYIRDAAQRQLALLNKLLDWSRLQTGRIKLDIQEINLENIVTNCVENHLGTSKQKEITLKSTLPRDMKVRGDHELLMQAFNNLISNALKFTPANGVISVDLVEDKKEEEWVVAVKDTGRGIPKEDIGKLFKAEEKYTRPGLNGEQGTGLGLSLVYEIVKQHNGSVSVESEVGLGTTFIIRLPRIVENKERVVIVVDDDEGVRVLHSRFLKRMYPDARVIQASNGKEAFELTKRPGHP